MVALLTVVLRKSAGACACWLAAVQLAIKVTCPESGEARHGKIMAVRARKLVVFTRGGKQVVVSLAQLDAGVWLEGVRR